VLQHSLLPLQNWAPSLTSVVYPGKEAVTKRKSMSWSRDGPMDKVCAVKLGGARSQD